MKLLEEEKGEEALDSINGKQVTVKVINPSSFVIDEDARKYSAYEGNGIAKQIKVPKTLAFKTIEELEKLEDSEKDPEGLDQNLQISDWEKLDNKTATHYIYRAFFKILKDQVDFVEGPIEFSE